MKSTIRVLFDQLVPRALVGRQTAFPVLSRIDVGLRTCDNADAAAKLIENCKAELHHLLSQRFSAPAAEALTLKILNICLAAYHLRARDTALLSRPIGLVVDPSNVCELGCPGCIHSKRSEELKMFDWNKGTLTEDRFKALLRRYGPFAIGIVFCNYGEPLLNRNTPKLIRLAKSYLMATALSTSLSVRHFDAQAYVESGLDFMVVSIDGVTQPVYEMFRKNGNLDLVIGNIRALMKAKRRLGKLTPALSWNFLAFKHNAHEIPLAERMARELGVNFFRVVNPFDVSWDDPRVHPAPVKSYVRRLDWSSMSNLPENWNPFPESLDAKAIADAFATPLNTSGGPDAPISGHTCHWLYKNMVMDAKGRIMPCCGPPRHDNALVFAQFDTEAVDLFNSEKYRQARDYFRTGASAPENAPHCTRCEWDHETVNVGGPEIRRYFRAADSSFFDPHSLSLLSAL